VARSVVRSVVRSVANYEQFFRWLMTLNGVSQYVQLDPVTLAGDFEISMMINPVSPSANDALLADDHGSTYYFRLNDANSIRVFSNGVGFTFNGAENLPTGEFQVSFVLLNTKLKCFVDGVQFGTDITITPYTGVDNFLIGSANSASKFFNGSLRDLKIWSGGDRTTGELIVDMPLDDGYANNPTARNTVGADGAFVNMTEASWSEVFE